MSEKIILPRPLEQGAVTVEARLVILRSEDEQSWTPVETDKIPKWITSNQQIIQAMHEGEAVKSEGDTFWYIGQNPDVMSERLAGGH